MISPCPESQITTFDHPLSLGHTLLGAMAAVVPTWAGLLIALGFLQYEANRNKFIGSQVGSMVEFASGFLAAKAASEI